MALLTLEGFEVPVLPGTEIRDETWGDYARAYSGRMRSDRRASHRVVRVVASLFDTADDAVALRTILNTPGPVLAGGTMIGDDAYFHVRSVQFAPQTVDRLSFSFELHETDDSPSPLLFSFDGDAPGTYTFTRTSSAWFTDARGFRRQAAANVLRREYLWLDGTYTAATLPDTAAYVLEAARTNLVSTDDISAWTDSGTPVITSSISDSAGGSGAYRVAQDTGTSEHKYLTVAFTGNATKAIVAVVRQATMPAAGNQEIRLYDNSAAASRLTLAISAWTSGVPTVAASTGTYLGKRYLGNGYWALYGVSTSVTAANTNYVQILPAANSGEAGSLDVYRVNAYNATTPPWSILDASGAQTADTYSRGFTSRVPFTMYAKLIETGAVTSALATFVLRAGVAGGTPRAQIVAGGSGYYGGSYIASGGTSSSVLATAPSFGDVVELCLTIDGDGLATIYQSINAGTTTTGTGGTAVTSNTSNWTDIYVSPSDSGTASCYPVISAKVARGVQTLAYMRDVAKGRLHPRTADPSSTWLLSASVAATSTTTAAESP